MARLERFERRLDLLDRMHHLEEEIEAKSPAPLYRIVVPTIGFAIAGALLMDLEGVGVSFALLVAFTIIIAIGATRRLRRELFELERELEDVRGMLVSLSEGRPDA